jgi:prevent-host-death family protein
MKTITAKEAKTRLGQAIDTALSDGGVMITKNGRDAVVLLSAEKYRELTGMQGFIQEEYATQKNKNRSQFGDLIKNGSAKAGDASMFHGLAHNSKVRYRSEEF